MRQRIKNTLYVTVDGVDLTRARDIEFYVRQGDSFSATYPANVVDACTMYVVVPKSDADRLTTASVKLQFAYTDDAGNACASDVLTAPVNELINAGGYLGGKETGTK